MGSGTVVLLKGAAWGAGAMALACTVSGVPVYPAAGVFAGSAIAAAAVHRSATGDCWANCSKGWHCDRDSGLCVEDLREEKAVEAKFPSTVEGASDASDEAPARPGALDASIQPLVFTAEGGRSGAAPDRSAESQSAGGAAGAGHACEAGASDQEYGCLH